MKAQYFKKLIGTDNAGNCIQTNPIVVYLNRSLINRSNYL
jgi:hypothetical protein